MPKISSVESQKSSKGRSAYGRKNNQRYNIFLDGQFAFGADEDLIVDFRLLPGKVIESSDLEKLLQDAEVGKIMERMYGLFNIRQRTEKEVRDYLKNLSFKRKIKDKEELSEIVIDSIIDKLKRKEMVDDLIFARSWMEARSKKKGPIVIRRELFQKGVGREIIEEIMGESNTENSEMVAQKLLEKRMERWSSLSALEFRKKAYDFLLRRGFDYEMVKNIVEICIKKR